MEMFMTHFYISLHFKFKIWNWTVYADVEQRSVQKGYSDFCIYFTYIVLIYLNRFKILKNIFLAR